MVLAQSRRGGPGRTSQVGDRSRADRGPPGVRGGTSAPGVDTARTRSRIGSEHAVTVGGRLGAEELVAAAAPLLGAVHRGVGVADERVGVVVRARGGRDPDAGADLRGLATDVDRRRERVEDALGQLVELPRSETCWRRTTNSSPPKRATTSWARTALRSRAAALTSSTSPRSWPRTSLTSLKPSRSTNISATVPVRWPWPSRASASISDSSRRRRFGSPVSGSCVACRARADSACLRLVMSSVDANATGALRPPPKMGTPWNVIHCSSSDPTSRTSAEPARPSASSANARRRSSWLASSTFTSMESTEPPVTVAPSSRRPSALA